MMFQARVGMTVLLVGLVELPQLHNHVNTAHCSRNLSQGYKNDGGYS
jgi:hypothetical protein